MPERRRGAVVAIPSEKLKLKWPLIGEMFHTPAVQQIHPQDDPPVQYPKQKLARVTSTHKC